MVTLATYLTLLNSLSVFLCAATAEKYLNYAEHTGKAMFCWSSWSAMKLHFIHPGKHTKNTLVESFTGKFCGYRLDLSWLIRLDGARAVTDR